MKSNIVLTVLLLVVPVSWLTAAEPAILLIGEPRPSDGVVVAVTNGARAIIKESGNQTVITAAEISFDPTTNVVRCVGDTAVTAGGRAVKGKDIAIELGQGSVRVMVSSKKASLILGQRPVFEAVSVGALSMPEFNEQLASPGLHLVPAKR